MVELRLPKFRRWLVGHGAQILVPLEECELIRFRARNRNAVVWNREGDLQMNKPARLAWRAYRNGLAWSAFTKAKQKRLPNAKQAVRTLLDRDGDACFYCGQPMPEGDRTVEHLLALGHGGNNHLSNLALAHKACNEGASVNSIVEKIRHREKLRAGKHSRPRPGL